MTRRKPSPRLHVVLLAGGSGTRFWPASRATRPKQFLPLAGSEPLLVQTWDRVRRLAPAERIWVVTPASMASRVRRLLPELGRGRLIVEPTPRDTAPAVALACASVARAEAAAITAIFPTDHVIGDRARFLAATRLAIRAAERGALVCLGIRPTRPATGFGYLLCASAPRRGKPVEVRRFVEKPDLARARRFLRSGRYLWNAGMFVWSAERFLEELGRTAPGILEAVLGHLAGRRGAWGRADKLSVDYAVMERAKGVEVVPLDARWDDVGSWDAAARLRQEAGLAGPGQLLLDSEDSVIFGEHRLVALVDLPGVVLVDTPDALLVAPRTSAERVKQVVEELRKRGRADLL